jgi:two-component system, OmpR family, heavy metal sensor histidine kinase CusS
LIGNATRFAERGSTIRVSIDNEPAGDICVVVENKGEPIASNVLPRLFDRFFRADSARECCETHHGLGLAIVSAIARMHGGQPFAKCENGLTRIGLTLRAA